jgi:zinc protease
MLMRGTSKRTRQQITDELSKLKSQVNVGGGTSSTNVSIETTRENLPAVMAIVAEVLREPAFPEKELEQLKQQQMAQIEQFRREPGAIASVALQQHLNPYDKDDPRYVRSPDEMTASLQAVTLADVKKFYSDFYGASHSELVIVGDFDPEQMQVAASKLLGDWKSPKPFRKTPYPYNGSIAAKNESFETPDKANAFIMMGITLPVGDRHADYPALLVGNYILGSGMNSRLFRRIRQKEGLSYGTGSNLMARANEDSGVFNAMAIFAPQNLSKVEAAIREEIAALIRDGITDAELSDAKKGWLQGQTVSRANDNELAGLLVGLAFENRDIGFRGEVEKKVSALAVKDVNEAIRRHLNVDRISVFKAGEFKKQGATP